jgi:hypothetical protein
LLADGFESFAPGETWADGTSHGAWRAVFNGYGTTSIEQDGSRVLSESPRASSSAGETHASLVLSNASFGDADVTVRLRPVEQLRATSPNPWEVGWLLWRLTDGSHFYYFLPKPNGWELGKEDPAYPGSQRFLATGSSPTFALGTWCQVRVRHVGTTMTVWVNGIHLTTFTDNERPYYSGALGLYNEDAHVHFDDVTVSSV